MALFWLEFITSIILRNSFKKLIHITFIYYVPKKPILFGQKLPDRSEHLDITTYVVLDTQVNPVTQIEAVCILSSAH